MKITLKGWHIGAALLLGLVLLMLYKNGRLGDYRERAAYMIETGDVWPW